MKSKQAFMISSPNAWKRALRETLQQAGRTRYEFVRECVDAKICTRHTAECLLADEGTVTGARKPSIEVAIRMARLAGYDLVMMPSPLVGMRSRK